LGMVNLVFVNFGRRTCG